MSYHKAQELILGILTLAMATSCTTGLDAGSIERSFSGVKAAKVMGPESVQISWDTNSSCEGYGIYRLGSTTDSAKIADATVPPYTVKAPLIESERSYSFAVGCNRAGKVQGLSAMKNVTTWPKFGGGITASIDSSGQTPVVVLNWAYASAAEVTFDLYAANSPLPSSVSSWALTRVGGVGSAYSNTKHCTVMGGTQVRLGSGGCPSLAGGQAYMFKVVAHYPDGTYSTDILGSGTYIDVPPPFASPDCLLTGAGIGADATTTSLFLRCGTDAIIASCPAGTLSTRAYQGVNGVRVPVSDTLTGVGTLRIQPQISASQVNDRSVDGLEIEYICTNGAVAQKSSVRYDGNPVTRPDGTTFTPIKPVLKFNSDSFVKAPNESKSEVPSYFGKASAVGDFNCDGKPDLAVGLPEITFNQAPYFGKNPKSGAVIIYYSYAQQANGTISSSSTQYLSFSDLPAEARFGASLASGNINRDFYQQTSGDFSIKDKVFACDDLIVGAPGRDDSTARPYNGEAYIFYGHPQKFSQPQNLSTLTMNDSTCHGSIDASVCDPVRLTSTDTRYYRIQFNGSSFHQFGYSVAFLRDFNADGYGDVAIGNPTCRYDGVLKDGEDPDLSFSYTGCVHVFWGGPNGLQSVDVGPDPQGGRFIAPYIKIYPPLIQSNMRFGESISGGGDIDQRTPVPNVNSSGNLFFANGSDMVVGAPSFRYAGGSNQNGFIDYSMAWSAPYTAGVDSRDPLVRINETLPFNNVGVDVSRKATPPLNGAWAPVTAWSGSMPAPTNPALLSSTGIAFAYMGRSSFAEYEVAPTTTAFQLMPNGAGGAVSGSPTLLNLLSASIQSRQNGSKAFTLPSALAGISPVESFYNCGTRGQPGRTGSPDISGFPGRGSFKHISCLAGRNNASWIFPQLKTTDTPVVGFGANVAIAGSKDQNPLALLELSALRRENASSDTYQRQGNGTKFMGYAQGNVHEGILGDSTWEVSIQGFTDTVATNSSCDFFSASSANAYSDAGRPGGCGNRRPVRAPIRETYDGLPPGITASAGAIQADINRDGYADVIVTARTGEVYTFFGNYAGDFSYPETLVRDHGFPSPYSTTSNCVVSDFNSPVNAGAGVLATSLIPFRTFTWAHYTGDSSSYRLTSTYPVRPFASTGALGLRLGYLGDVGSLSSAWGYGNIPAYSTDIKAALGACLPQRRKYLTAPSSLVAVDLNDDRTVDGVIGFPAETSSTGMARALIANSSGSGGLASEFVYNAGTSNFAQAGLSVSAANWRYIQADADAAEETRRDLFLGAPYQEKGNGAVLAYSGSTGGQVSSSSPTTLTFNVPIPSLLAAERSKIIGDVNGDGYDDIFVPVKRLDARGNLYFDAVIYFGSSYGPITTPFCLAKQSSITKSNGSVIASSDCNASISGLTAIIGTTPVRLPQYFPKPTGMFDRWPYYIYEAGDINGDARADLTIADPTGIYAIFGSDLGLVSGSLAMGPSANKTPQIVSRNADLIVNEYDSPPVTSNYAWVNPPELQSPRPPIGTGISYTHGDFNGDGYEDVAIGRPGNYSYQMHDDVTSLGWNCSTHVFGNKFYCGDNAGNINLPANGRGLIGTGIVHVFYGGPRGVQTPINTLGASVDFDFDSKVSCSKFYHNCTKAASVYLPLTGSGAAGEISESWADVANGDPLKKALFQYSRIVYGSIYPDPAAPSTNYLISTTASQINASDIYSTDAMDGAGGVALQRRPACVPGGSGAKDAAICVSTIIPPPVFHNLENSYTTMRGLFFGGQLTTSDINGDGIDDLVVGNARFSHRHNDFASIGVTDAPGSVEPVGHGAMFVYYGAKNYGLVAPVAEKYLGGKARGVTDSGNLTANSLVFQIYPKFPISNIPTYDFTETSRGIGYNSISGDFNGDGYDDLAVATSRGQAYVYYGPICQWDNALSTITDSNHGMYPHPNQAIKPVAALSASDCQTVNLSLVEPAITIPLVSMAAKKILAPQMMQISGLSGVQYMGSTMIARRKGHGSLKIPGTSTANVASDLIIAGSEVNDPNAATLSYKFTGLGYAFFGHPESNDPITRSKGGLFISNASYNSSIVQIDEVVGPDTFSYYYYSPVIMRPHSSDSTTGRFFYNQSSSGDVNGDGRMDLLMPTDDLHQTQDGTSASFGGGFRLFY